MNQNGAIVSTDLDGTLLGRGNYEIGNQVPEALARLAPDKKFIWVINTGRRYEQIFELIQRAEIDRLPDYFVDRETFIHKLEGDSYVPLADWNDQAEQHVAEVESMVAPHLETWCTQLQADFPGVIIRLDSGVPISVQCVDFEQGARVRDTLKQWTKELPKKVRIVRNGVWVSIWADGYDKGSVLHELTRRHNVPVSHVMSVGDSENDLPMLDRSLAGWPVAPGNAEPIVKQFVKKHDGFVSEHPDIDGVLDGLQRFVRNLEWT